MVLIGTSMAQIGTSVSADAINKLIVAPLVAQIDDVIHLDRNRRVLGDKLQSMKLLLQDICNAFQNQLRTPPESIGHCLESTRDEIAEAKSLIERSQLQQRCLDCKFCKPRISTQIREWSSRFDQLRQELLTLFSIFANAQQVASSSAPPPAELLQPLPEWGIVGMDIQSAKTQLQTLIDAEAPQFRIIAVFGMAGVGKTTLLKSVYNFYKVSDVFEIVIWVTVSQDYKISELQRCIAEAINLDLSRTSDIENRKIKLSATLKNKKFLLILDDMWTALDFQELGVAFVSTDKGSKVLFSTRSRDLALEEGKVSIKVEPLSRDEGWALFQRIAFKGSHVPDELKDCARNIADECEGLPLAITVVAAAMSSKSTVDDWSSCFSLMKNADPAFPETHPRVDKELYRKLRWSYDDLSTHNLQNCFLYCALFPEDHRIDVEQLVLMWIAEGFVKSKEATYSKDLHLGYRYVKILIDRGLFQNVNFERQSRGNVNKPVNVWKPRYITTHDVIRDMAIYIGEKEDNYLCRAGQQLKDFPRSQTQPDCKRISLLGNEIESVPEDLPCPNLVSLILSYNKLFLTIPESFMMNLTSLRVLNLSYTGIQSVPTSLTQLSTLDFLDLSYTAIKELPEDIGKLTRLQYLNLDWCLSLVSLPCSIGKLKQLQYMGLWGCSKLVLPPETSQVTSVRRLDIGSNIGATIGSNFGLNTRSLVMGTWSQMEHLRLSLHIDTVHLPTEIQFMKRLQSFRLHGYKGVSLPNWICDFQQLERLDLWDCPKLGKLPSLEKLPNLKILNLYKCFEVKSLLMGSFGNPGGFPMLEMLILNGMGKLQSLVGSSEGGIIEEGILCRLTVLKIFNCSALRKLPMGIEKLPNLRALYGAERWWKNIIWEDDNMKIHLHKLFATKYKYNSERKYNDYPK